MIDGKNVFNQPVRSDIRTYNIRKITTGQQDDYKAGCLLDYTYFKTYYKMIAIDLSKQQAVMLIQKQHKKLILLEKYKITQQYFSLLKKLKKQF